MRPSRAGLWTLLIPVALVGGCSQDADILGPTSVSSPSPLSPPVIADLAAHDIDAATIENIEAAVEAVRNAPNDWQAWLALGMQYQANEMLTQAIPCYRRAAALAPEQARPFFYLAQAQADAGELAEGVATMRTAAALADDFAPVHWRLGLLLLESSDTAAAARAFERALELDPSARVGWVGLARVALQEGRPEQALQALERVSGSHGPNDGYIQRLLGTTYARLGRTAEAEQALGRAGTSSPSWTDPWTSAVRGLRVSVGYRARIGERLISSGRVEDGVRELEKLRKEHPEQVSVLQNLGVGYGMLGRYDDAIRAFETLLESMPRNAPTHENLARAQLRKATTTDPATAARLQRAAKEHVELALELAPRSAGAHGLHGTLLAAEGRYADAAREYRAAFDYDPQQTNWGVQAAGIYRRLEDWPAVAELLESVSDLTPDKAGIWYELGLARIRTGELEEAERALRRAVELVPNESAPRQALEELRRRRGSQG